GQGAADWGCEKTRHVAAFRNLDPYRAFALATVEFVEPLAQLRRLHADDGVGARIEIRRPIENLDPEDDFLNGIGLAGQRLLHDIGKETSRPHGSRKLATGENPVEFCPDSLGRRLSAGRFGRSLSVVQHNTAKNITKLHLLDSAVGNVKSPPKYSHRRQARRRRHG